MPKSFIESHGPQYSRAFSLLDRLGKTKQDMILERSIVHNTKAPEAFSSFNLFQTPQDLALKMVDLLGDLEGKTILEPSCGLARLLRPLRPTFLKNVTACELDSKICGYLYSNFKDIKLKQGDFLEMDFKEEFDRVIMNPPFKMGRDIKHIMKAYGHLKEGGILVALCFNGVKQNEKLKDWADTWEVLPEGTFKEAKTGASVVLLTKEK